MVIMGDVMGGNSHSSSYARHNKGTIWCFCPGLVLLTASVNSPPIRNTTAKAAMGLIFLIFL